MVFRFFFRLSILVGISTLAWGVCVCVCVCACARATCIYYPQSILFHCHTLLYSCVDACLWKQQHARGDFPPAAATTKIPGLAWGFARWYLNSYMQKRHMTVFENCRYLRWRTTQVHRMLLLVLNRYSVDKENQLDVTFCILYFSSNSCSTCFGHPCAHHQELTTAWCYSLVLLCAVTICGFI